MKSTIGMDKVRRRRNDLTMNYIQPSSGNTSYLYESVLSHYSYNNAKIVLKDWQYLDKNTNIAFSKAMDIFSEICVNGKESEIKNAAEFICEGVLRKVRNGEQSEECVHRKIGWVKRKLHEKIDDRMDAAKNAFKQAKQNVKDGVQDIKNKDKAQIDKVKDALTPKSKKEEKVDEAFNMILETCDEIRQCDRVLNNHTKFSKRFNIDEKVRSLNCSEDVTDCIFELCEYIDTYNMPFGVKYNVALENIRYCFEKNAIPYQANEIASIVTDYFLMNTPVTEGVIHDVRYILSKNRFYTDDELSDVKYVFKEFKNSNIADDDPMLLEEALEKNTAKEMLQQFKLAKDKTVTGLKALVKKMYVKSDEDIINETVNMFALIRVFFVIGATAINPILGVITLITDFFISMDLTRKNIDKSIKIYEKEIDKTERAMEKAKNENHKKNLKAYRDKLKEDMRKIENYAEDRFTAEENDKRSDEAYERQAKRDAKRAGKSGSSDLDDFNIDFSDLKFETAELEAMSKILLTEKLVDNLKDWNPVAITEQICSKLSDMNLDDIDNLVTVVSVYPEMFDISRLHNSLSVIKEMARKETGYDKYVKIDCYANNEDRLDRIRVKDKEYDNFAEFYTDYEDLNLVCEAVKDLISIYSEEPIMELGSTIDPKTGKPINPTDNKSKDIGSGVKKKGISAVSKLKLAAENFKKGVRKGIDVEKNVSNKIDMSMDTLSRNVDRALASQNREAVIKGSILPSASKIIKLAIVTGGAALVSPAVAVIGLLGYIGASAVHRRKERQMIMDEIDLELDMCNRYIKLAEDKNDMKAIKSLLQTKRALEKQRAVLRYHAKIEVGQKLYTTTNTTEED